MKNILLSMLIIFCSNLFAQEHKVEISINPWTSIISSLDSEISGYNIALEYQVDEDFGLELGIIKSSISYVFDSEFGFLLRNPVAWNKIALQGNYYLRPALGMDRWFITGMANMESYFGDFDFTNFQFTPGSGTVRTEKIIKGNVQRYYVGIGMGYKRVLYKRIPIKLSLSQLRVFANHYSDSLKEEIHDLDKKSYYSSGVRLEFTIGYRFYFKKAPKVISE